MADELDAAQQITDRWMEAVHANRQRGDNPAPNWIATNYAVCVDCGEENTPRAQIGRGRCIDCQEEADRNG